VHEQVCKACSALLNAAVVPALIPISTVPQQSLCFTSVQSASVAQVFVKALVKVLEQEPASTVGSEQGQPSASFCHVAPVQRYP
jgi:hypothetical protein